MNKTLKKVIIFLVLLVIVLLIINIVEMHRKDGPAVGGPVSPSASASPSPSSQVSAPASPASPHPSGVSPSSPSASSSGSSYQQAIEGTGINYAITADSGSFQYVRVGGRDMFVDKSVADGSVYIEIKYTKNAKSSTLSPGFLDSYIAYKNIDYGGDTHIGTTNLTGNTITATDGKIQMTAWLMDFDGGVVSVVTSCSSAQKDTQTEKLMNVLNTLTING